eukprot:CAMPEP_0170227960 /NCGR_PEP_ID=MMETSP0116_2-20130129/13697_1 /TAXON_ID=400756 /ORGANISM="Durinskia baltica, Strain CSIRO CS-38" /LENGTH=444 /DNA_ID=CAMNT_0010478697 /DNA_START=83 /DNA_END=1418 /DNA_ORIENTATION=-
MGAKLLRVLLACLLAIVASRRHDATRLAAHFSPRYVVAGIGVRRPPLALVPTLPALPIPAPQASQLSDSHHPSRGRHFWAAPSDVASMGEPQDAPVRVDAADEAGDLAAVGVPTDWAAKLVKRDDSRLDLVTLQASPGSQIFRARLRSDPEFNVLVEAVDRHGLSDRAAREIHMHERFSMMQRLPGMGRLSGVAPLLANASSSGLTFLMTPADATLAERLAQAAEDGTGGVEFLELGREYPWKPMLEPDELMAFIIDILRGLRSLERAGIVHTNLGADSVVLRGGRAYIAGLGRACLEHEAALHAPRGAEVVDFSAAPELRGGVPATHAGDVWAAGMLFAELAMGVPVASVDEIALGLLAGKDMRQRGLRLYNSLAVEARDQFDALPTYLQELLQGMLEKDERRRWSADRAFQHVLDARMQGPASVAAAEEPQPSISLPPGWFE